MSSHDIPTKIKALPDVAALDIPLRAPPAWTAVAEDAPMGDRVFLFVTGDAPRSQRARAHLGEILARLGANHLQSEIIDIFEHPARALAYGVFSAPALVIERLNGRIHILQGDLSDELEVEAFLDSVGAVTRYQYLGTG